MKVRFIIDNHESRDISIEDIYVLSLQKGDWIQLSSRPNPNSESSIKTVYEFISKRLTFDIYNSSIEEIACRPSVVLYVKTIIK